MTVRINPRLRQIPKLPDKSCARCGGSGRRYKDGDHGQTSESCPCVIQGQILYNMKFTWPLMLKVPSRQKTPLTELAKDGSNAWIVSEEPVLASHLRCMIADIAYDEDNPHFWVEYRSDKDVVEAWLKTAQLTGVEIIDADVALSSVTSHDPRSIKEFALRADLMVIQLGKKLAANKETDTTFVEALEFRIDEGLATWIVVHPADTVEDLLVYSDRLGRVIDTYDFIEVNLKQDGKSKKGKSRGVYEVEMGDSPSEPTGLQRRGPRLSLSGGSVGEKRTTDIEADEERKRKEERQRKYDKGKNTLSSKKKPKKGGSK